MKTIKYLLFTFAAALFLTSCYEDKGSYDTSSWTDIVSVEGVELPLGLTNPSLSELLEGSQLEINPVVTLKQGVSESDFSYCWVLGDDTIGTNKKLSWTVEKTSDMVFSEDQIATFWLSIKNNKSGEEWRHFAMSPSGVMKVKIISTMIPKIGVVVYRKPNNEIEWGSIKGGNKDMPATFSEMYTGLYDRYNGDKKPITGDFVNATFGGKRLLIYTNTAPDYGVMIQTADDATYPLGAHIGTLFEEVYVSEAPTNAIVAQNYYQNMMQELLIGNSLYIASTNDGPYQVIVSGMNPTQNDVAQVMGAAPFNDVMHFSIQRTTDSKLYYYVYSKSTGYKRVALTDAASAPITADKIVGVFRQPTIVKKTIKMFVVTKEASNFYLYSFSLEPQDVLDKVTFIAKKDVAAWAGGMTEQTKWFTNAAEAPLNYLFIVKGKDIWRTSYEGLDAPIIAKSFADEIVDVAIGTKGKEIEVESDEYYTAVFTYNSTANTSSMHVLNARTNGMDEFSSIPNAIPGRVLKYLPAL